MQNPESMVSKEKQYGLGGVRTEKLKTNKRKSMKSCYGKQGQTRFGFTVVN